MGAEQLFWGAVILVGLLEAGTVCWIMEKKEKRIKAIMRNSEKRRKKHYHEYYCAEEAARLYNKFNLREGGMKYE